MAKPIDHSGERLGSRLLICKVGSNRRGKKKLYTSLYKAKCDCGAVWIGTYANLKHTQKYCGKCQKGRGVSRTPRYRMWKAAKERAAQKGLMFSLSLSDIVIPKICPVLGIPLFHGNLRHHDNSPTLDRITPRLGYIPHNVRVISHRANSLKNNGTLLEFELILKNWNTR